ncbi:GNAT family N-acetyltransferase [Endozoicomonas sp. 2B-B]
MEIKTERTVIEVLGIEKAELMLTYYLENKAHLQPWEPKRSDSYFTLQNFSEMLGENHKNLQEKSSIKLTALTPDKSEIIGVCNFTNIVFGYFKACNLGYSIGKKYEGNGLMAEILSASINQIFSELNLHRIMANYIPTNIRSAALL